MTLAALEIVDCPRPEQFVPGDEPRLEWIDLSKLRVDQSYQRPVADKGRKNIAAIVAGFRWNRFSPVIVTALADGLFAVIDGQHRAIAAQQLGLKRVPCQVVAVAPREAAAVFAAINGNVTPMTAIALFKAARAAGEKWALDIDRICRKAGVEVLTYPVQIKKQKPCQTMMVGTLRHRIARFGTGIVGLALEGMMRSPQAERPGFVRSLALDAAITRVMATEGALDNREETIEALSRIDYGSLSRAVVMLSGLTEAKPAAPAPSLRLVKKDDRERVLDLHGRHYTKAQIAAMTRLPYSEIDRIISRGAA